MAAPYWGQLPKPQVVSPGRNPDGTTKYRGPGGLSIDTTGNEGRLSREYPPQSKPRQYRSSIQTEATASTLSPFASPTASSFRGDGLAPRPPSFPYPAADPSHKDYLDKRRRRVSRNREIYDEPSSIPPPAAPDAPPQPPPLSYRPPQSNTGRSLHQAPTQYQVPAQSRSSRRSDRPVSPTRAPQPEDYYRAKQVDDTRRRSSGKAVVRDVENIQGPGKPSDSRARKGSLSEAEAQRRKEWAPDRSPLQRLELTLDSITKEEKRARVEEAELRAREGREGEGPRRSSVRFRNKPVAKASEQPQESSTEHIPKSRPPAQSPPREVEPRRSPQVSAAAYPRKVSGHQSAPVDAEVPSNSPRQAGIKPAANNKNRSAIPVAVAAAAGAAAGGLGRSTSNKLKKDPPEDPWLHRRVDAEKQFQEVRQRQPPNVPGVTRSSGVSRQLVSDAQSEEKELPSLPTRADLVQRAVLQDNMAPRAAGRRLAKRVEPSRTSHPVDSRSQPEELAPPFSQTVTVNGIHYAVPSAVESGARPVSGGHHHLSNLIHKDRPGKIPSDGIYIPTGRLDEWKKGGVALLAGELLDLEEVPSPTEAEKDKAWWEAGHTGQRRRSSTKQRKAEAYDGEYDDSNGIVFSDFAKNCNWCEAERQKHPKERKIFSPIKIRDLHYAGYDKKTKTKILPLQNRSAVVGSGAEATPETPDSVASAAPLLPSPTPVKSPIPSSSPVVEDHLLTCPMRGIRVRPDIAPTRFKPPLFLKSGPLLRYCGLRRERLQGRPKPNEGPREREIWRGSVMIVTQDAHSSYELKPTLRLFLQPMDLLPPPPAELDDGELAAEYVDPIAGLPKIGRDGRTLYVRPVEHLEEKKDLSREESDDGLFETTRSPLDGAADKKPACQKSHYDGEKAGKYKEVRGFRLHAEQGVTFWRFNIEIELRDRQQRIAYRINRGPATGFWVPASGQTMNIMFYSCNGFSHGMDPNQFNGPDPMWRDVLNTHQTQPFHVMLGGGDQLYNDAVIEETTLFKQWCAIKDPHHKERVPFTLEMQTELEGFYLNRYCMWFSQGLFGLAASQIPMINIFDDHDIIDGFGSYPDDYMSSPIFSGLGCVAFKYYMLFQHQSSIDEGEETEPSWILGTQPGPYIKELSRTVFTHLGRSVAFLGLDCRTERMNDEIVSAETYHRVFDRLEKGIVRGETKHLIVLVGVPTAYPRMVWLENILTSRFIQPVKMLGRAGLLGQGLLNKMDGGVEILDDLDDHWTARHHKDERNWLIQELQDLAAEKSIRVTILGGDVHLGGIGQFYSNPKLGIPKDKDHRYMPNVISSAIVNSPPPDTLADLLNKRNKVHHLDSDTDEDMIPIFTHDVTGKPRNNKRLLNRRNWCSIRPFDPELSPPPTPESERSPSPPPQRGLLRRFSSSHRERGPSYRTEAPRPPVSNAGGFFSRRPSTSRQASVDSQRPGIIKRTLSLTRGEFKSGGGGGGLFRRNSSRNKPDDGGINGNWGSESEEETPGSDRRRPPPPKSGIRGGSGGRDDSEEEEEGYFPTMPHTLGRDPAHPVDEASTSIAGGAPQAGFQRTPFHRTPTGLSEKQRRKAGGNVDISLEGGLDICLNMEVNCKDPAGITMPYRLLVPALLYEEEVEGEAGRRLRGGMKRWVSFARRKGRGSKERFVRKGEGRE